MNWWVHNGFILINVVFGAVTSFKVIYSSDYNKIWLPKLLPILLFFFCLFILKL